MPVTREGTAIESSAQIQASGDAPPPEHAMQVHASSVFNIPMPLVATRTPSKILNNEVEYGMLINRPQGILGIIGKMITAPQLLDRCIGELLYEAEKQRGTCTGNAN